MASGDQPIINLRATLETEIGLRIFYGDLLPSPIAGMYDFVLALGCCLYINRKHPPERRRVSMVHEYGHGIVDRHKPAIDYLFTSGRKPANERFADAFAAAFLMPATSVRRRFLDVVNMTSDFQVADLCRLAHAYFVSVEAMAYRLEKLGLVPKGRAELLKESRLPVREAKERLRLSPHPVNDDPFPERYKALAVYAYEQEKITEGQLARFLRCDRVTAREIVQDYLTSRDVNAEGQTEDSTVRADAAIPFAGSDVIQGRGHVRLHCGLLLRHQPVRGGQSPQCAPGRPGAAVCTSPRKCWRRASTSASRTRRTPPSWCSGRLT